MEHMDAARFVRRIAVSHTLAYFVAGIFALGVMGYREHYASGPLSLLMRPVDSPWVALGPALQIVRGAFLGLVLLPLRAFIASGRRGLLVLAWITFGLSAFSTIGPAPGSFEGLIYTTLPLRYQLLGIPEMLLYVGLFTVFVGFRPARGARAVAVLAGIATALVMLMSLLGVMRALGKL